MITFHPTVSLLELGATLFGSAPNPEKRLTELFPGHHSILTDSGRSALAVIIEALHLEGTRMAVPAFLCTNLLPVLTHYRIEPVFIDSEPGTFQFHASSYAGAFQSALVVATYGQMPDATLIETLERRSVRVIEDYAHVPLPNTPENFSRPRYYSIAKTLPAPDGGIALLPREYAYEKTFPRAQWTPGFLKNTLKLWRVVAAFLFRVRILVHKTETQPPAWHGITAMASLSRRCLGRTLAKGSRFSPAPYAYCYPLLLSNPERAQQTLFKNGIIAERIWNPIIAGAHNAHAFPNAYEKSNTTLCLPLWHIDSDTALETYEKKLQNVLAGEFAGFRQ
ncbi:MAG: hypothetical protein AMXMBFR44_1220 [Candidatus Campbellbacteria bacterium]